MSTNNEKEKTTGNLIQLTREELMSQHVDELLLRQKNLLGERSAISRKSSWYYQNWFIFLVAGCIAAFAAWAIIEPIFDDFYYIQGQLEAVTDKPLEGQLENNYFPAFLRIRGEEFCLHPEAGTIIDGHPSPTFSLEKLKAKVNQEIGIYVDIIYDEEDKISYPVVLNVDYYPAPNPPAKALLKLSQILPRQNTASLLLFPLVAGFIGLAIGAADGIICRVPRRALIGGGLGLVIGFFGGFFSDLISSLVYSILHPLARGHTLSTLGFILQVVARGIAWSVAGMTAGLGYGISLRSKRLVLYGFLGGVVGGLLGGLFFDPIERALAGEYSEMVGANISRLIGLVLVGGIVGAAIGIVEKFSREAWLRMTHGPLAGKEFIIFKDVMHIGASPKNEIYLFNDPQVNPVHARILTVGDNFEIESQDNLKPVLVNDRPARLLRLHNGDRITIGRTSFIFTKADGVRNR